MRTIRPHALTAALVLGLACTASAQVAGDAQSLHLEVDGVVLDVRPQAPDEAYDYLLGTLGSMEFFRQNGYQVALPEHPAFAPDLERFGSLEVFEAEVYQPGDFADAMANLAADQATLREALAWFSAQPPSPDFHRLDAYEVRLTLYGPGGSYDAETGTIVLFCTTGGEFKGGGGVHTIVHEMMHIAVEGLVQRFGLTHWQKEHLVDLLVEKELGDVLPTYTPQSRGDATLDPFLEGVSLAELPAVLERFVRARVGGS